MSPLDQLIDAAEGALEFLSGQEDVVDGDYGEPKANRAMQVATYLRDAIKAVEAA